MTTVSEPLGRFHGAFAWSGTEMIVWGGTSSGLNYGTGGRYNPATNTWTPTSSVNAPEGWLIVRSEDLSFFGFPFGANGDTVAPGDYDGDGKFDATVFRPSSATWFIARSTAGTQIVQFGATGDRPIPNSFVP